MANILTGISSSKPILLWENAAPTAIFPAQTITLPSGYVAFYVETVYGNKQGTYIGQFYYIDKKSLSQAKSFASGGFIVQGFCGVYHAYETSAPIPDSFVGRMVTTSENSITFSEAIFTRTDAYTSQTLREEAIAIPLKIYGIKKDF